MSRQMREATAEVDARPMVVVGGGSGFIGHALGVKLAERFDVVGTSRAERQPDRHFTAWRRGDLFNLREAEAILAGARFAIYLVHSMLPSARLTQAAFEDLDLLCADNFARAAKKAGVEQIVYLGGLVPDTKDLSPHLASRLEVEETLGRYGVPVTTLRAGLVIGGGGSSFEIMTRLVERLPAMVVPKWTLTRMQPVAVDDVVALLSFVVGRKECYGETYDVGAPEALDYRTLMAMCAEILGLKRSMVPVPLFTPGLSRLWVSLVTGAPRALVAPLVESLRHEMVARDLRLAELAGLTPTPVRAAMWRRRSPGTARRPRPSGPMRASRARRARRRTCVRCSACVCRQAATRSGRRRRTCAGCRSRSAASSASRSARTVTASSGCGSSGCRSWCSPTRPIGARRTGSSSSSPEGCSRAARSEVASSYVRCSTGGP